MWRAQHVAGESRARRWSRLAVLGAAAALPIVACKPAPESGGARPHGAVEGAAQVAAATAPPTELGVGQAVERQISAGESHDYLVVVERGELFELRVEQRGVDVSLQLFDPRGEQILEMDLPIADVGPEFALAVAEQSGSYRLEVTAAAGDDPGGGYRVTLATRRLAGDRDRLRARAVQSFSAGEQLALKRRYREAIAPYEEAVAWSRQAGDELWLAEALDRMGNARTRLGDLAGAVGLLEEAAALFARLDEPRLAVVNVNRLAQVYFGLAKMDQALQQHVRALELRRRLGDRRGEAMSLASMANIFKVQGETQQALDHFKQALERLDRPEDQYYRAVPLHNLGTLYRRLGKREEALERLREARQIFAQTDRQGWQAAALSQIGLLAFESGEYDRARRKLEQSLELRRQLNNPLREAAALRKIGSVLLAQGDVDGARQRYQQALELLGDAKSPRSQAMVLADLGLLNDSIGRDEEALAHYRRSLAIFQEVGDPVGQAESLLGVAAAERRLGRPSAALESAERALDIAETLRVKPLSEDLRLSFFSTVQRFFDFNIELLMELDRGAPGAGHGAAALQVGERARSRSLLDLLSEAGAEIRGDAAPELLAEERELQRLLNRSVELMQDQAKREEAREAAARDVRQALDELDEIRTTIRRNSPRYASLTQPRPLSVEQIQRQLLDEDTLLLEYRLGGERSFLWLVGRDSFESFELEPAAAIEATVRQAHEYLAKSWRRESEGRTRSLLCELSRQLLRPAAGRLDRRRLAIVADGALEYLPFAALPDPDSPADCLAAEPLVASHEIARLPSASTLAVLRRESGARPAPVGQVAVVADPVFSADDPRLGPELVAAVAPGQPAADRLRGGEERAPTAHRRLPYSRAEADAILELVPGDQAYRAVDFDASKEAVLSGRLSGYRVVHFATHGILDAERPELSQVVLSQVDRRGRPIEGVLRAHEIYNLRLAADLVVLAGCETALGKEVRGEGLVGLARGFMYAGASRVMVSLWKVSDRGTADLMRSFYRGLLQGGLSPPAALRQAQLEMRESRPQPFYWAGFVVLGDWRGSS